MKKILKYVGWGFAAIVLVALGVWLWAHQVATSRYEQQWTVHKADFPIPFPLSDADLASLRAERILAGARETDPLARVDLKPSRSSARSSGASTSWTVASSCDGCHGNDFGGAAVVDIALVGHWVAPNLTTGEGSVTKGFTANDWDRAVRHGVRHNGQTSSMPSQDFVNLTDHELSDIVAYIRSLPPVNRDMGAVKLGPVFAFMIATDPKVFGAPRRSITTRRTPWSRRSRRPARNWGSTSCRSAADATARIYPAASSTAIPTCRSSPISRRTRPASSHGTRATSSTRCAKASARTARRSAR